MLYLFDDMPINRAFPVWEFLKKNIELRAECQLGYYWAICNACRRKPEPPEETYAVRESRPLYHMRSGFDRESNPQPQTRGDRRSTDVNFEHRSYHCATLTALWEFPIHVKILRNWMTSRPNFGLKKI
jgi:hypothetical protein